MVVELKISIKDEEKRKLSRDFLVYESFSWQQEDPVINRCLKELLEEFKGEPDDIKVRATMILR